MVQNPKPVRQRNALLTLCIIGTASLVYTQARSTILDVGQLNACARTLIPNTLIPSVTRCWNEVPDERDGGMEVEGESERGGHGERQSRKESRVVIAPPVLVLFSCGSPWPFGTHCKEHRHQWKES